MGILEFCFYVKFLLTFGVARGKIIYTSLFLTLYKLFCQFSIFSSSVML